MHCQSCGDLMCAETVIRLRRTLFGLREQRLHGAYCACCRTSVMIDDSEPMQAMHVVAQRKRIVTEKWRALLAVPDRAAWQDTAVCASRRATLIR